MGSAEAYDIAYRAIERNLTACQHDGECYLYDYPAPKDIQPCGNCGSSVLGSDVKDTPQMTSWTCQCGARRESLKRHRQVGFGSIIDRLRHKVAEMEAEENGTPPPAELVMIDENTHVPDDKAEPVYIVRSEDEAWGLSVMLRMKERFDAGELTKWYTRNSIYVCDAESRKILLSKKLNKDNVTGPLGWKPVVLTFADPELERKLSEVCVQVVTVPGTRQPGDAHSTITLEDVRAAVKEIKQVVFYAYLCWLAFWLIRGTAGTERLFMVGWFAGILLSPLGTLRPHWAVPIAHIAAVGLAVAVLATLALLLRPPTTGIATPAEPPIPSTTKPPHKEDDMLPTRN